MPIHFLPRRTALAIIVIVLVAFISLPLQEWAFEQRFVRYVALGFAVVGIALWPCMVLVKYNALVDEQAKDPQSRTAVRKTKLVAEICAGFALISFLSVFFRWGEQLDKKNGYAPYALLAEAETLLYPIMTPAYCNAKPYRINACDTLQTQLAQLRTAVSGADQKQISEHVRSIEFVFGFGGIDGLTDAQDRDAKAALRKVQETVIDNGFLAFIFAALPLYAFIFALSAVSSKTAVALFEYFDGGAQHINFQRCRRKAAAWTAVKSTALRRHIGNRQGPTLRPPLSGMESETATSEASEGGHTPPGDGTPGPEKPDQ